MPHVNANKQNGDVRSWKLCQFFYIVGCGAMLQINSELNESQLKRYFSLQEYHT